jgi:hypothetical protein
MIRSIISRIFLFLRPRPRPSLPILDKSFCPETLPTEIKIEAAGGAVVLLSRDRIELVDHQASPEQGTGERFLFPMRIYLETASLLRGKGATAWVQFIEGDRELTADVLGKFTRALPPLRGRTRISIGSIDHGKRKPASVVFSDSLMDTCCRAVPRGCHRHFHRRAGGYISGSPGSGTLCGSPN